MAPGSVLIVTHNSAECIEHCVTAVLNANGWKVVLIDNASSDLTVQIVRRVAPTSFLTVNTQNRGFAAAVNQAVRVAEGEVLILLNPDVIPTLGSLDKLAQAVSEEQFGAATGMLAGSDGAPQKGFTLRRLPTLVSALAEVLLVNRVWPSNPWNRHYRCVGFDYTRTQEVEQPAGACLAIKRQAWEDAGGFDESFFPVWFEDVDFCRRLRDRGWKILYCPDAVFVHSGGHSVGKLTFYDRQAYWYGNLLRYFGKHHPHSAVLCLRSGIIAGLVLRSFLSLIGVGPAGVPLKEALSGYWHVIWEYGLVGRGLQLNPRAV
jgi:GT2 family glycosyltransferase